MPKIEEARAQMPTLSVVLPSVCSAHAPRSACVTAAGGGRGRGGEGLGGQHAHGASPHAPARKHGLAMLSLALADAQRAQMLAGKANPGMTEEVQALLAAAAKK